MLLKNALERIASRPQEHKPCADCLSLLWLCSLCLALALLDGSHGINLAGIDS